MSADAFKLNDLARMYARTHEPELRSRIVTGAAALIRSISQRFVSRSQTLEDIEQVAAIGLLVALDRYDPDNEGGATFATYAVSTMRGHIKHFLRDHAWSVKTPRYLRELAFSIRKAEERLQQRLDRSPTATELAAELGVTEEVVAEALDAYNGYDHLSLDGILYDDEKDRYAPGFFGAYDPELAAVEKRQQIYRALTHLDSRKQRIIIERFYEDRTQYEVADNLGISQMHVSRLERQALKQLRAILGG